MIFIAFGHRAKKLKEMEHRVDELDRMVQNIYVETFISVANCEMPDKSVKQRITLRGMVDILYKKIMGKVPKTPPLIHKIH